MTPGKRRSPREGLDNRLPDNWFVTIYTALPRRKAALILSTSDPASSLNRPFVIARVSGEMRDCLSVTQA